MPYILNQNHKILLKCKHNAHISTKYGSISNVKKKPSRLNQKNNEKFNEMQ